MMDRTQKAFLKEWEERYVVLIDDIENCICQELVRDIEYYMGKNRPEPGAAKRLLRKALSFLFRLEEGYWEKSDRETWLNPKFARMHAEQFAKLNPEFSVKQRGLHSMAVAILIMKLTYKSASSKWLLRVLRDFSEIYNGCPDKRDVDVFVEFIHKEDLLSNKDHLAALQTIPEDVKDTLSLNFDRNLKPFVAEYDQGFATQEEATIKRAILCANGGHIITPVMLQHLILQDAKEPDCHVGMDCVHLSSQ